MSAEPDALVQDRVAACCPTGINALWVLHQAAEYEMLMSSHYSAHPTSCERLSRTSQGLNKRKKKKTYSPVRFVVTGAQRPVLNRANRRAVPSTYSEKSATREQKFDLNFSESVGNKAVQAM